MAYSGTSIPIPLGELGLRTDAPSTSLPPNALIKANNVSLVSGRIEKTKGTTKYNPTALPGEIVCVNDYWPTPSLQRLIAATADGKIYRDTGDKTFTGGVAIKSGLGTLTPDVHMVSGGQESAGKGRKLFIFTGTSQVQVIVGDGSTTSDISDPSADFAAGNYPTFGLMYQNRMCVMGVASNRHQLYFSMTDNHMDFKNATTPASPPPTMSVFPGEGDGILCAAVYRGLLFVFKKPFGVYIVDGRNPDTTTWTVSRYSDSFGVGSPHAVLQVLTDLTAANSFGSYTSLQASDSFGDFEAGDILSNNMIENYIRSVFNANGIPFAQSVYYPEKKLAYFTGQSSTADVRDQMLILDVGRQQLRPTLDTKEKPNCLALRRDTQLIQRPMYGDKSGFVWLMDQPTYNRDTTPYIGEFQTAYTDFSFASGDLGGKNKIFDFLEVNYIPTGNNDFYCDVFIDGQFRQTLTFTQRYGAVLGSLVLGVDKLAGDPSGNKNRKPLLSCTGNKISFRFYNNSFNEGFKIERIVVSFRVSGEQIYSFQT